LTIVVGDKKIVVHSVILASFSSLFNASMCPDLKENKSTEIEIKEFNFETVKIAFAKILIYIRVYETKIKILNIQITVEPRLSEP